MSAYHYLGFRKLVGESIKYVAEQTDPDALAVDGKTLKGAKDEVGKQVCRIKRITYNLDGEFLREETAYGITSMSPEKADATRLLKLNRGHWCIENRLHWVRDVTFDEDRSQIRKGAGPQVMATLRNLAISLFRLNEIKNVAQAMRNCCYNQENALQFIGL